MKKVSWSSLVFWVLILASLLASAPPRNAVEAQRPAGSPCAAGEQHGRLFIEHNQYQRVATKVAGNKAPCGQHVVTTGVGETTGGDGAEGPVAVEFFEGEGGHLSLTTTFIDGAPDSAVSVEVHWRITPDQPAGQ